MNLLLLLSALLSALTGVGSVRGPQGAQTVAERVQAVAAVAVRPAAATARPVQAPVSLLAVAAIGVVSPVVVANTVPAWTTRRRE